MPDPQLYEFTVTIPNAATNLPADAVVNTWHFARQISGPPDDFDNVRDMLKDFYTVAPPGTSSTVCGNMPSATVGTTWTVKAYRLADPEPRAPAYESTFNTTSLSASVPLPAEVAIVLFIQAAPASGVPQARRRNRKYLGPFGTIANQTPGRPLTATRQTICLAAKELLNAAQASNTWGWRVYSPTTDLDHTPVGGWVDDAWDTQRRRGLEKTGRILWSEDLPA